ncbi:MAG: CBS domain-containing protein [Bacillota bacterium]
MSGPSNADRFLNAYAVIEHEMQKMLDLKDRRRFYDLIDKAARVNPVINRYKFDLKEYGDLRNAIVHDRADGQVIAEPNNDAVAAIERIAGMLLEPPRVVPLFQKRVLTLSASEAVTRAVKEMSRHAYTQVPLIEADTMIGLLTSNMIVKWMGKSLTDGSLDLEQTTLGDVLRIVGHEDNYRLVSINTSLFKVVDLFYRCQVEGNKLEAVLITEHANTSEPLIGIITNRDLPLVQRELDQAGREGPNEK